MSSIQTLHDALIALTVTVGIAVALAIMIIAVAAFIEHGKNWHHAAHDSGPAQHAPHSEDVRHLILR